MPRLYTRDTLCWLRCSYNIIMCELHLSGCECSCCARRLARSAWLGYCIGCSQLWSQDTLVVVVGVIIVYFGSQVHTVCNRFTFPILLPSFLSFLRLVKFVAWLGIFWKQVGALTLAVTRLTTLSDGTERLTWG